MLNLDDLLAQARAPAQADQHLRQLALELASEWAADDAHGVVGVAEAFLAFLRGSQNEAAPSPSYPDLPRSELADQLATADHDRDELRRELADLRRRCEWAARRLKEWERYGSREDNLLIAAVLRVEQPAPEPQQTGEAGRSE